MSEIVIRCPVCSKGLKLKDLSRIGKKAKCPQCETIFVMQMDQVQQPEDSPRAESKSKKKKQSKTSVAQSTSTVNSAAENDHEEEVEFQLAQPAQKVPLEGAGGRWVPDDAPLGVSAQSPAQQVTAVFAPTAPHGAGVVNRAAAAPAGQGIGVVPVSSGVARLGEIRRRNKRRNIIGIIVAVITASAFYGAYSWAEQRKEKDRLAKAAAEDKTPKRDEELAVEKDALRANSNLADANRPTKGAKINLAGLPMGISVVISIRPAELLEEGTKRQEFWYCLGPFGEWLAGGNDENGQWVPGKLEQLCHRKPADIEHALIGIIPGEVGEPAQFAAVVTLKAAAPKSELLIQYGGDRNDQFGYPVYINDEQAFLIKDLKTIAICPAGLAKEMADAVEHANSQSDEIESLLQETDIERHCTLIFNPRTLLRHEEVLFAPNVLPLVHNLVAFFNDDEVETVSWAVHIGDTNFHSEILMRNRTAIREHQLESEMRRKLDELPDRVWHELVEKMNPTQLGHRRVISRFPAMMKLFSRSTIGGMGSRYAQLVTVLPERAAPNMALGSLLAWDESTRTDFTKAVIQQPTTSGQNLPALVVDRLKLTIEVEFKRMPLQEAIAFIAGECRIAQSIDGDALKDKGYTKNMPQTFAQSGSGFEALKKIMSQYDDMCIVLDEKTKSILLTTRKFAAQNSQTVFEIP